jgi:hypothetical protein
MARFVTLTAVCCAAVLLLSQLPVIHEQMKMRRQDNAVFQALQNRHLNTDNLVDVLLELPLHADLGKVEWGLGILSIDLRYVDGKTTSETLFKDIYEVLRFGFYQTDNVEQVLLRVVDATERLDRRPVMMALSAKRDDWTGDASLESVQKLYHHPDPALAARLQLIYTKHWRERLGDPI